MAGERQGVKREQRRSVEVGGAIVIFGGLWFFWFFWSLFPPFPALYVRLCFNWKLTHSLPPQTFGAQVVKLYIDEGACVLELDTLITLFSSISQPDTYDQRMFAEYTAHETTCIF